MAVACVTFAMLVRPSVQMGAWSGATATRLQNSIMGAREGRKRMRWFRRKRERPGARKQKGDGGRRLDVCALLGFATPVVSRQSSAHETLRFPGRGFDEPAF